MPYLLFLNAVFSVLQLRLQLFLQVVAFALLCYCASANTYRIFAVFTIFLLLLCVCNYFAGMCLRLQLFLHIAMMPR